MANKFLLALAFLTFHLISAPAFATNVSAEGIVVNGGTCSAPPPDSFRITGVGTDFIDLAWKPVLAGALHDLTVFQENNIGGWENIGTTYNIAESSYTVTNLESGRHYKFQIATKCPNGDPSELTSTIDGITLILELTTGGRIPLNPTQVSCMDIDYKKYEWVGFRVTYVEGEDVVSNLFEYKEVPTQLFGNSSGIKMQIKRVDPTGPNPIVAKNESGLIPYGGDIFASKNPFYMSCLTCDAGDMDEIGQVIIVKNLQTINLCNLPHGLPIWNPNYIFEPLIAYRVKSEMYSQFDERSRIEKFGTSDISVQSPFNDELNIFDLEHFVTGNSVEVKLITLDGNILYKRKFEIESGAVSIPIETIPSGFYILRLESNGRVVIKKAIKP